MAIEIGTPIASHLSTNAARIASRRRERRGTEVRDDPMSNRKTTDADNGTIKDPAEWTTGDEPMTGAQDSYVHTLARKVGEEVPEDMTKAEASMKIDELREKTGVDDQPSKPRRRRKPSKA
jgi:hypothetical protein